MIIPWKPLKCDPNSSFTFERYIKHVADAYGPWRYFIYRMQCVYQRDERVPKFTSGKQLEKYLRWRLDLWSDQERVSQIVWDMFVRWQRMRTRRQANSGRLANLWG